MITKLLSACLGFCALLFLVAWEDFSASSAKGKHQEIAGSGLDGSIGYYWQKDKGGKFAGSYFNCAKEVGKCTFYTGEHYFPWLSRSIKGKYLFAVKGKLFMLTPETGKTSTVMEDKFSGLLEGVEIEGCLRVLVEAGPAPGFGGRPWYKVIQIMVNNGKITKKNFFERPVLFSVSAGKRGIVGVLPNSEGHLEVVLSQGAEKPGKKLGLVPIEWYGGPISWAIPSKDPRFLSLAFNALEPGKDGFHKAFLMVIDLDRSKSFTFQVKYRPPRIKSCPGPALAMGWLGGRYLLTSGVGRNCIDAVTGKYVDCEKIKEPSRKDGDNNDSSGTIGNFLLFVRNPGKKHLKYPRKKYVGLFILGKGIYYADGEKVVIPENGKPGNEKNRRFSVSPKGRFALLHSDEGERLWLVDGKEKKVVLLAENVFDWGWIK